MDEFLEKMQEDQRRMRRFLRANGPRFKQMGEALAAARQLRSRVFVIGEPPLDAIAALVAEDYLTHLPALSIDLTRPAPASVNPDESGEVLQGRAAAAKQAARHLHAGDLVLALLIDGNDRETRMVLESARAKRVTTLVLGGLDAKANVRRLATARVNLPTQGVKTICESIFVCARILARVSRAAARDGADDDELVLATCEQCNERVFFEARSRGRGVGCPLCQGTTNVPKEAVRRAGVVVSMPAPRVEAPAKRRKLKPSVLAMPAIKLDEDGEVVEEPKRPPSSREARVEAQGSSRERRPVGSSKESREGRIPSRSSEDELGALDDEDEAPSERRQAAPPEAPVGLVSNDQRPSARLEPAFGSDILVGSDVVSTKPPPPPPPPARDRTAATTQSADPYALDDAFLADLEMPAGKAPTSSSGSADGTTEPSRRLSARFTMAECPVRWGRGGYPDDTGPTHELVALTPQRLEFRLDPDDEAGSTLQKGDELFLRIVVPAFIEPVLVHGALVAIRGGAADPRGTRVEVEFKDLDPTLRRKLARAAEGMGAPA